MPSHVHSGVSPHFRSRRMPDPVHTAIAEVAATVGAGAAALFVGVLKLFERFQATKRSSAATNAELVVMQGLQDHITRLLAQNTQLSESVAALHKEVLALREENGQLRMTIRQWSIHVGQAPTDVDKAAGG